MTQQDRNRKRLGDIATVLSGVIVDSRDASEDASNLVDFARRGAVRWRSDMGAATAAAYRQRLTRIAAAYRDLAEEAESALAIAMELEA